MKKSERKKQLSHDLFDQVHDLLESFEGGIYAPSQTFHSFMERKGGPQELAAMLYDSPGSGILVGTLSKMGIHARRARLAQIRATLTSLYDHQAAEAA